MRSALPSNMTWTKAEIDHCLRNEPFQAWKALFRDAWREREVALRLSEVARKLDDGTEIIVRKLVGKWWPDLL